MYSSRTPPKKIVRKVKYQEGVGKTIPNSIQEIIGQVFQCRRDDLIKNISSIKNKTEQLKELNNLLVQFYDFLLKNPKSLWSTTNKDFIELRNNLTGNVGALYIKLNDKLLKDVAINKSKVKHSEILNLQNIIKKFKEEHVEEFKSLISKEEDPEDKDSGKPEWILPLKGKENNEDKKLTPDEKEYKKIKEFFEEKETIRIINFFKKSIKSDPSNFIIFCTEREPCGKTCFGMINQYFGQLVNQAQVFCFVKTDHENETLPLLVKELKEAIETQLNVKDSNQEYKPTSSISNRAAGAGSGAGAPSSSASPQQGSAGAAGAPKNNKRKREDSADSQIPITEPARTSDNRHTLSIPKEVQQAGAGAASHVTKRPRTEARTDPSRPPLTPEQQQVSLDRLRQDIGPKKLNNPLEAETAASSTFNATSSQNQAAESDPNDKDQEDKKLRGGRLS